MVFRVRRKGGGEDDFVTVELDAALSPAAVEMRVAAAVDYDMGSFVIRQGKHVGRFHGGLDGDWDAVQPTVAGVCGCGWVGRQREWCGVRV